MKKSKIIQVSLFFLFLLSINACNENKSIDRKLKNEINLKQDTTSIADNCKNDSAITHERVGCFKLGTEFNREKIINTAISVYSNNIQLDTVNPVSYIRADGPEMPKFFLINNGIVELIFTRHYDENKKTIASITILSPRYKLLNRLYVGQSIAEIRKTYPNMKIAPSLLDDGVEYLYLPKTEIGESSKVMVMLKSNDQQPLVNSKDSILNNNILDGSNDFMENGKIVQMEIWDK